MIVAEPLPEGIHPELILQYRQYDPDEDTRIPVRAMLENVEIVADRITDLGVVPLQPTSDELYRELYLR